MLKVSFFNIMIHVFMIYYYKKVIIKGVIIMMGL